MKNISWKKIYPHLIAVGIFLVVAIFYCKPALQGKVLQQTDVQQWKGMAESSFKYKETHGHFPLWVNSLFAGMPGFQIAMDSSNPISPGYLHSLFTLFLPAPFSFFFLLCVSFYFLTQVLKIDYRLGILASIAYAYASFTSIIVAVGHVTQVQAMGYVPALLASIFLVFQKKYWWGGALSGVFACLLIAMNHLQITYYFLLIAAFAFIAYLIQWIKNKEYKHILITCCILGVAAAAGVAVNSVSLATTYDFAQATMRGGSNVLDTATNKVEKSPGLPIDYAFQWSYGQAETFTLLVPNIYGGASSGQEFGADSHLAKEAVDKGVPDDQATQFAQQFPAYWGAQTLGTSGPVYLGAVICMLFIFGMGYLKGFDKWWIAAVCLLGILMSWGKNFMGFNEFLFNYLPMYNKFRAPTMSLYIPQLLFPLLSVMALQKLFFEEKDKISAQKNLKTAGLVMLGIFVIVGMFYMSFDYKGGGDDSVLNALNRMAQGNTEVANSFYNALKQDRQSLFGTDLVRSLFFAGAAFLLLWLFVKNKFKVSYALIGLLLLSSIDVIAEGRRYLNSDSFSDAQTIDQNYFTPSAADAQIMRDPGYFRVFNTTTDYFNDALTSYFHNSVGGYSPVKLSIVEDLLNFQLRKNPPNMQVLNMLNTKYFIVPGQQNQPVAEINPNALGPVWFVKAIEYKKGPAEVMKAMENFDPKDTALVEESSKSKIPFEPVPDSSANIRLIKNDNDVITYESSSKTNQFAVFSEIYYDRGWKAYIDNKEAPIVQVNYVLRGLTVPAGNHNIRFEFKPASYYESSKFAVMGSAIIWLWVIGAIAQDYRKKKNLKAV
jgi:Bacterial membrane protein YfhO